MRIQMKIVFYSLVLLASSSQQTKAALHRKEESSLQPFVSGDDLLEPKPNPTDLTSHDKGGDPTIGSAKGRDGIALSVPMSEPGSRSDMAITPSSTLAPVGVTTITPSRPPGTQNAVTEHLSSSPTMRTSTLEGLSFGSGATSLVVRELVATSHSPDTFTILPSLEQTVSAEASGQPSTQFLIPSSTQAPSTGRTQTFSPAHSPEGPIQSELNVGDEDSTPHHSSSPLDPLLAGLVSIFIVTTAIVSLVLFLRFRQRIDPPEFHRLRDLPMDDLMEDTPLSRFSY